MKKENNKKENKNIGILFLLVIALSLFSINGVFAGDYKFQNSSGNTLVVINGSSGYFGIGTGNPSAKLQVQDGALLINGTTGITPVSGAGTRMMWIPSKKAFRAGTADGTLWDNSNIGEYSFATGSNTTASGKYSTAMGQYAYATGLGSIAIGSGYDIPGFLFLPIEARGDYAIAMGYRTNASGDNSIAMGVDAKAPGDISIAMGWGAISSGYPSVAIGTGVESSGSWSTAFGTSTTASGGKSTAMGWSTLASGDQSTAIGSDTIASGEYSTVIGYFSTASGGKSTAMGNSIIVNGNHSFGIGLNELFSMYTVDDNNVFSVMGGKVGIGTGSPTQNLDVHVVNYGAPFDTGDLQVDTCTGANNQTPYSCSYTENISCTDTYTIATLNYTNYSRNVICGKANAAISGKLGIGTANPSQSLEIYGAPDVYTAYVSTPTLGLDTCPGSVTNNGYACGFYEVIPNCTDTLFDGSVNWTRNVTCNNEGNLNMSGVITTAAFRVYNAQYGGRIEFLNSTGEDDGTRIFKGGENNLRLDSGLGDLYINSQNNGKFIIENGSIGREATLIFDPVTGNLTITGYLSSANTFGNSSWNQSFANTLYVPYNGAIKSVNLGENNLSLQGYLLINGTKSGTPILGAGTRLMWIPNKAAFRAGAVDGSQWNVGSIGNYSTAMGYNTMASGFSSMAMGYLTKANATYSTAMGHGTTASGLQSTAMGANTTASAQYSTAMGWQTSASAWSSTAMGVGTTASGMGSTAMGFGTRASGEYSTAMGEATIASGKDSTAMGDETNASGETSTAMGAGSKASGRWSTAMGIDARALGEGSIAMGEGAWASGNYSIAIGRDITCSQENATCISHNVGIGTGSPTHKLNVIGDVNITGNLIVGGSSVGGGRSYLSFVDQVTAGMASNGFYRTSDYALPSINYTMVRAGQITGISVFCAAAPSGCTDLPDLIVYKNGVTTSIIVNMTNGVNDAYNSSTSASFNAGDRLSVYSGSHNCDLNTAANCQALVEITT